MLFCHDLSYRCLSFTYISIVFHEFSLVQLQCTQPLLSQLSRPGFCSSLFETRYCLVFRRAQSRWLLAFLWPSSSLQMTCFGCFVKCSPKLRFFEIACGRKSLEFAQSKMLLQILLKGNLSVAVQRGRKPSFYFEILFSFQIEKHNLTGTFIGKSQRLETLQPTLRLCWVSAFHNFDRLPSILNSTEHAFSNMLNLLARHLYASAQPNAP